MKVVEPSDKNINSILKDKEPHLFPRKEQVKQLLDFLMNNKDRLLIVHGPRDVGKVDTIAKAVTYAYEHSNQVKAFHNAIKDGAYFIDLSLVKSITEILGKIIERLSMDETSPERDAVLNSAYLDVKKCLLVFERLEEGTDL